MYLEFGGTYSDFVSRVLNFKVFTALIVSTRQQLNISHSEEFGESHVYSEIFYAIYCFYINDVEAK